MISLKNISYKYDTTILDNISVEIDSNKITYIIGSNGSGKSTLAGIISGLLYPKDGQVIIDKVLINKKVDNKLLRKKIGMVFQNPSNQIIFSKVYDDIKFTLDNMKVDKEKQDLIIIDSLKKVGMGEYINSNPYNLSGGQKQRVAIASQISLSPNYLIFDEATSMLDINGKKDIYKLIQELKKEMGIIFITNNMEELVYADDIIIIDNRKVYKYTLNDIMKCNSILTNHNLDIPFIFKIASKLKISDPRKLKEEEILKILC